MTISLSNQTLLAAGVSPPQTQVSASYAVNNDSSITKVINNGSAVNLGAWDSASTGQSAYEVEFTMLTGTCSGTFGSWLNLGTSRSIIKISTVIGFIAATVQVQIRDVATHTVQATCTITLDCNLTH